MYFLSQDYHNNALVSTRERVIVASSVTGDPEDTAHMGPWTSEMHGCLAFNDARDRDELAEGLAPE